MRKGQQPWATYTVASSSPDDLDAIEFSIDSERVTRSAQLAAYAQPSFADGVSLADGVVSLCARVHAGFEFDADATQVDTPLVDVMEIRKGVCQDFSHVMIGSLHSLGLAACHVSGYIETKPPPGKPRSTGVDHSHAWVSIHLGSGRCFGIDPTNNQLAGPRYVTAARGRDYSDVPPLRGIIFTDAKKSKLTVSVDVATQHAAL